jgi:hypothetical protein
MANLICRWQTYRQGWVEVKGNGIGDSAASNDVVPYA